MLRSDWFKIAYGECGIGSSFAFTWRVCQQQRAGDAPDWKESWRSLGAEGQHLIMTSWLADPNEKLSRGISPNLGRPMMWGHLLNRDQFCLAL